MGGAVSAGQNNDELIDNLVEAEYIKTPAIEKVFHAVDRGDYYLPEHRDSAYKDLAWKNGNIHLSAPCIYAQVMESLNLEPGLSFLNLGSGTGYLNTLVGLIIGPYGVNHGVEYHGDVIQYATSRLENFKKNIDSFDEYEFCEPKFTQGNCLLLNSGYGRYSRVYCGASCPSEHENFMKNLLKVGGVLVMPLEDHLLQITRVDETTWTKKSVLPVSFASLIIPNEDQELTSVELPEVNVMTLQEICRISIRKILSDNIRYEHPNIGSVKRKASKRPKHPKLEKRRRLTMRTTNMGVVLLNSFQVSDSDEEIVDRSNEHHDSETSQDSSDYAPSSDDPGDIVDAMQRELMNLSRARRLERLQEQDSDSSDQGISDDDHDDNEDDNDYHHCSFEAERSKEAEDEADSDDDMQSLPDIFNEKIPDPNSVSECKNLVDGANYSKEEKESESARKHGAKIESNNKENDQQMNPAFESTSQAIPILQTNSDRRRYSSTNSMSTSVTSGIGTCSSIEEPLDFDNISHDLETHFEIPFDSESAIDPDLVPECVVCPPDSEPDSTPDVELPVNSANPKESCGDLDRFMAVDKPFDPIDNACDSVKMPLPEDGIEDINMEKLADYDLDATPMEPSVTFRHCIQEKVNNLPIPVPLKQFLLYYRNL